MYVSNKMFKFCKKPQDLNLDPGRSDESIKLPTSRPPISWPNVNEFIYTYTVYKQGRRCSMGNFSAGGGGQKLLIYK